MRGVHDVGGETGFGAVPLWEEDPTLAFHADWEARIFGIYRALAARGLITPHQMRDAVERLPRARYLRGSYYERWLLALTLLTRENGLVDDN